MKTAIIGANGQLGRDLISLLDGEVIPVSRADADFTDHAAMRAKLTELAPQIVINCAAYNLVDKAESVPADALAVNTWAAKNLAEVCRDLKARLVHFSTDYVFGFDSQRDRPFGEDDLPGPVSNYGLSKLAGEYAIRAVLPEALIIRTCGLYGRHGVGGKGGNFVETMKRIGRERGAVKVVNDQRCTPTSTVDLGQATVRLLKTSASGIVHITNTGSCTWFEFATEIFRLTGLSVQVTPITSAEFGAAARRPPYSVLDTRRYSEFTNETMPRWEDALARYTQSGQE
ncbi:dTDP-4-dehydrorhamnose reductase [Zavarzinella formosa]|uniref:dTDP-4-dehydrorhamnose reductase n=1 Tax=Zavarzinella formosa TaxID=360055 RepID=UPI0002F2701E|nr:dTDP-4-dehydrorhamnose reductase [Zavarzinella formosa]